MTPIELRTRTAEFARAVEDFSRPLLLRVESRAQALQLRRSSASVAASLLTEARQLVAIFGKSVSTARAREHERKHHSRPRKKSSDDSALLIDSRWVNRPATDDPAVRRSPFADGR